MKMESLFTGDQYNLKWNSHKNSLVNLLEDHLSKEELVDVTLFCSGKYIRAHKLILSACSSYFREIFQVHKVENPLIILNNVKYEYLKYIIDFIYNGEIRVRDTELEELLLLGNNLKVKGLLNVVEKHIDRKNIQNNMQCKNNTIDEVGVVKDKIPSESKHQNKLNAEENSKKLKFVETNNDSQNNTLFSRGNIHPGGPNTSKSMQNVANKVLIDSNKHQNKCSTEGSSKMLVETNNDNQNKSLFMRGSIHSVGPIISSKSEQNIINQVVQTAAVPKITTSGVTKNKKDVDSPKPKKRKISIPKPSKHDAECLKDPLALEFNEDNTVKIEPNELDRQNEATSKDNSNTKPMLGEVLQVKPVSAFMIFANEWRRRLAFEHPNESNKEISVRLGNMWKNLSDETRDRFYETASRAYEDQKRKLKTINR